MFQSKKLKISPTNLMCFKTKINRRIKLFKIKPRNKKTKSSSRLYSKNTEMIIVQILRKFKNLKAKSND